MNTMPSRLTLARLLAGLLAISLGVPGRALGALLVVNTKNDVVADDGHCSLREAVSAANQNKASGQKPGECSAGDRGFVDVIQLRRGTYQLKRLPIGEDQNAGGDLDVTESVIIQGKGLKTVIQNGIGDPTVSGDGDRLFHIDPFFANGVDVKFTKLTLARGDVGCTGSGCVTGGSAVDQRGNGSLTFDTCTIMRNTAVCSGDFCGQSVDGAAITTPFGGALTIRNTTIKKNETACSGDACVVGGAAISMTGDGGVALAGDDIAPPPAALDVDGTTITQNLAWCEGRGCQAGGTVSGEADAIRWHAVTVTANGASCYGPGCSTEAIVGVYANGRNASLEDILMADNYGECSAEGCTLGPVLDLFSNGSGALRRAELRNNLFACTADLCAIDTHYSVGAEVDATADAVEVTSDVVTCSGASCTVLPLLIASSGGAVDVFQVKISGNQLRCQGPECQTGALTIWLGEPVQSVRNEINGNLTGCEGEACRGGGLLLLFGLGESTIEDQTLLQNLSVCSGVSCQIAGAVEAEIGGSLSLAKVEAEENTVVCSGRSCVTAPLLDVSTTGDLAVDESRLAFNAVGCEGDLCAAGGIGTLESPSVAIESGLVTSNLSSCSGGGCRTPAAIQIGGGEASIARSAFTSNDSLCNGEGCGAGPGGAIRNSTKRLTVVDTSLVANHSDGYGGAIFNDAGAELLLERSLLSENTTGLRNTMEFGGFGGAVYNDATSGKLGVLTIVDSEISRNRALRNGGGVLNEGTIARFVRSTISSNSTGDCVNQGGSGCP